MKKYLHLLYGVSLIVLGTIMQSISVDYFYNNWLKALMNVVLATGLFVSALFAIDEVTPVYNGKRIFKRVILLIIVIAASMVCLELQHTPYRYKALVAFGLFIYWLATQFLSILFFVGIYVKTDQLLLDIATFSVVGLSTLVLYFEGNQTSLLFSSIMTVAALTKALDTSFSYISR